MYLDSLKGVIPALATPLTENENVDENCLREMVKRVIRKGVNGILVLGSAGEGVMLGDKEKAIVIETVLAEIDGRVPVIAGTGDTSTNKIIENNKIAAELGADYALVVPPFYFRMEQNHVEEFYKEIADESPIPIMIYNIPANTKISISAEVVENLSQVENIVGIKDSSGDWVYFQKLLYNCQSDKFKVFSGVAKNLFAAYTSGADGSITPVPNIDPETEVNLYNYVKSNKYDLALELQKRELELALMFGYGVLPVGVKLKAALELMGICKSYMVRPLPQASEEVIMEIRDKLVELNLL